MNNSILDLQELMDRVMEDRELILELADDFSKDYPENRKLLGEAIAQKDFEKIKDIAHRIKGAAGNISVKPMFTCCFLIEQFALANQIDLILELIKDLDVQFREFQEFIAQLK